MVSGGGFPGLRTTDVEELPWVLTDRCYEAVPLS